MSKGAVVFISILTSIVLSLGIFFFATPRGRTMVRDYQYSLGKVDEKSYENKKQVEDTCRAMIASYINDSLTYKNFKNSNDPKERDLSNQALTRANRTASAYNEFILENKYVWQGNVPSDIAIELDFILIN